MCNSWSGWLIRCVWLIHCVWACIVEELEEFQVNFAERVENEWMESGTQWLNGDVIQEHELCDFALVCASLMGRLTSFKVLVLRSANVLSLLMKSGAGEDEVPALVSNRSWLFSSW